VFTDLIKFYTKRLCSPRLS